MIPGGVLVALWMALRILGGLEIKIEMNQKQYVFYQNYGIGLILGGFVVGIILIIVGRTILKKENQRLREEKDEKELDPGENVIYKKSGSSAMVIVTNKRVRYYGYLTKEIRKSVSTAPDSDREDYEFSSIKFVKPVLVNDVVKSRFTSKRGWGVKLELNDGRVVHIPVEDQDEVANRIDNARRMASA